MNENELQLARELYLRTLENNNRSFDKCKISEEYRDYLNTKAHKKYKKTVRKLKKEIKFVSNIEPLPQETYLEYLGRAGGLKFAIDALLPPWKNYAEYCNSEQFKRWRKRVLRKAGYICEKCGSIAVSAHHLKYRKWGTEKVSDGLALCWPCHMKLHST